jgi:hypothetical protein
MYRNFHLESAWPELLAAQPAERWRVSRWAKRLVRLSGAGAWLIARRARAMRDRRER